MSVKVALFSIFEKRFIDKPERIFGRAGTYRAVGLCAARYSLGLSLAAMYRGYTSGAAFGCPLLSLTRATTRVLLLLL